MDILINEREIDIYGHYICVIEPEGYKVEVGKNYEVRGQGGMYRESTDDDWEIAFGVDIPDTEHAYGYNLVTHYYTDDYLSVEEKEVKVPYDILITHFKSQMDFNSLVEQEAFIKKINRDRNIDIILDE